MLWDDPFLYRALRPGRGRGLGRRLLLALAGPALLSLPAQLDKLQLGSFHRQDSLLLGVLLYVTYLCVRSIGGSVGRVSQERERGSWEVLLSVGMSRGQIGRGLWLASTAPVLLEVLLTFPFVYGEFPHPWWCLAVFLSLGAFYCGLGLFASLRFPSSLRSAQFAYGWLGLSGGASFFAWLFTQIGGSRPEWREWLLLGNPWALAIGLGEDTVGLVDQLGVVAYALGAVVLAAAIRGLVGSGWQAQAGLPGRVDSPCRAGQSNPLLYRHRPAGWARQWALGALYLGLVLAPWMAGSESASRDEESRAVLSLLGHLAFWLVRVVQSSCHLLCREREQGTLDALLTTRLKASEMLLGFTRQAVTPLCRQALWLSPVLLFPLGGRWGDWLLLVVCTQVYLWAWGSLAMAVSLVSRSTVRAFQTIYLALAFMTVGTLVLDVLVLDSILHWNRPVLSLADPVLTAICLALNQRGTAGPEEIAHCRWISLVFHALLGLASSHLLLTRLGRRR